METQDYTNIFTEPICRDALDWLKTQPNLAAAWDNCERGDWLWWALRYLPEKMPTKAQSAQFASWCAERASATADAAAYAAYADAAAADAAYYTARATAAAAYYAADWAADDAFAAAYSAATAAAYAADAADAADAAYYAERQAQAEWIRENISNPFEG